LSLSYIDVHKFQNKVLTKITVGHSDFKVESVKFDPGEIFQADLEKELGPINIYIPDMEEDESVVANISKTLKLFYGTLKSVGAQGENQQDNASRLVLHDVSKQKLFDFLCWQDKDGNVSLICSGVSKV